MILAVGEFDNQTAEHSIKLLDLAYYRYFHISLICVVIADHGSQFYANKRDKDGFAAHSFENYCHKMEIHHILCKYNHPQSNGKIETWFDLYNRKKDEFDSFEEMIVWYNSIRPHLSLNVNVLETPEQAFYQKCEDISLGIFMQWVDQTMKAEI